MWLSLIASLSLAVCCSTRQPLNYGNSKFAVTAQLPNGWVGNFRAAWREKNTSRTMGAGSRKHCPPSLLKLRSCNVFKTFLNDFCHELVPRNYCRHTQLP